MKKKFVFLAVSVIFLGLVGLVSADTVSLPNPLGNTNGFPQLICRITGYVFGLIGALAVLMFIWAGILFVTSAGNEAQLGKAKKALFYAVIGAAIAIGGQGLIQVVAYILGGSGQQFC